MICLQTSPNQQQAPTYWHILARYLSKEQHSLYGNAFYLILNSVATSLLGLFFGTWSLALFSGGGWYWLFLDIGLSLTGVLSRLRPGHWSGSFRTQEGAKANQLVNVVFTVVGTIA